MQYTTLFALFIHAVHYIIGIAGRLRTAVLRRLTPRLSMPAAALYCPSGLWAAVFGLESAFSGAGRDKVLPAQSDRGCRPQLFPAMAGCASVSCDDKFVCICMHMYYLYYLYIGTCVRIYDYLFISKQVFTHLHVSNK